MLGRLSLTFIFAYLIIIRPISDVLFDHVYFYQNELAYLFLLLTAGIVLSVLIFFLLRLRWSTFILFGLASAMAIQSFLALEHKSLMGFIVIAIVFGIGSWKFSHRVELKKLIHPLALWFVLLTGIRYAQVPWKIIFSQPPRESLTIGKVAEKLVDFPTPSSRPNVYHFVFDRASGSSYREFILNHKNDFTGHVFYPRATSPFGFTIGALAAIDRGRMPSENENLCDYIHGKDESPYFKSMREHGYNIVAHDFFRQVPNAKKYHESELALDIDPVKRSFVVMNDMVSQFVMAYFPAENRRVHFKNASSLNMMKGNIILHELLDFFQKPESPKTGMYYLLYIGFPHPPYIFDSECQYQAIGANEDSHRQCMNRTLAKVISSLKKAHGNQDYNVIIQADHGETGSRVNPLLISNAFSKSEEFLVSPSMVSVVDLIPSIHKKIVGVDLPEENLARLYPQDAEKTDFLRDDYYLLKNFDCKNELRLFKMNSGHPASQVPHE